MATTYILFGFLLVGCGGLARLNGYLSRDRPEDQSRIKLFVEARGLRVISIKRASSLRSFCYMLRWYLSNVARVYAARVEDAEGVRADIYVAFDSWMLSVPARSKILSPRALRHAPPGRSVSLNQMLPARRL